MPEGARGMRQMAHNTCVEVLMYMSPAHSQFIMDSVAINLNASYLRFIRRNPRFSGKVSILSYSLGSILCYDLLAHQPVKDAHAVAVVAAERAQRAAQRAQRMPGKGTLRRGSRGTAGASSSGGSGVAVGVPAAAPAALPGGNKRPVLMTHRSAGLGSPSLVASHVWGSRTDLVCSDESLSPVPSRLGMDAAEDSADGTRKLPCSWFWFSMICTARFDSRLVRCVALRALDRPCDSHGVHRAPRCTTFLEPWDTRGNIRWHHRESLQKLTTVRHKHQNGKHQSPLTQGVELQVQRTVTREQVTGIQQRVRGRTTAARALAAAGLMWGQQSPRQTSWTP